MHPVLFFHGTPGDDSQADIFRQHTDHEIITYDRHTDVPTQDPAHILALSGGGPYALEYVKANPKKAITLTMWSAVTMPMTGDIFPRPVALWLMNRWGARFLKKKPLWVYRQFLKKFAYDKEVENHSLHSKKSWKVFWHMLDSVIPFQKTAHWKKELEFARTYNFNGPEICVPTMLVHGLDDQNVSIRHAENLLRFLCNPHSFTTMATCGHFSFFGPEAVAAFERWDRWIGTY